MLDHYDVGIVGCWYWGNYGSLLNGYATFEIIKSFGLKPLNITTPYNGFESHAKKFIETVYGADDISPALKFEELNTYNKLCDSFVTGSDQIWHFKKQENPRFAEYFRLKFADEGKRKVSFATSFGRYIPEQDENVHQEFIKLMQRYDAISVREDEAVSICEERYDVQANKVIEPVFSVEKEVWDQVANLSDINIDEPYLLTYILDPTDEKRSAIEYYSERLGIKYYNILDGFSKSFEINKQKLNLPNTLENIWCGDFLKLFQNAKFVITDSFHGCCFSVIYNKPFIAIGNELRGMKRFESLLSLIGLQDRLVLDAKNIPHEDYYISEIDYSNINTIIKDERLRTVAWLKNALLSEKNDLPSITINKPENAIISKVDEHNCIGCGACITSCAVGALSFTQNEDGYYCPKIDRKKCINCGKCIGVCPVVNIPTIDNEGPKECYEVIHSDRSIQLASSSGGAFSVLAEKIFELEGAVVGAAWTNDYRVEHRLIEDSSRLAELRKSKYMQSFMGNIYKEIREHVLKGQKVLVVACPCQIAGLINFLGKNYDNLILVDLLCGNSPSSTFFQKYVKEEFGDKLVDYVFRYKDNEYDWDFSVIKAVDNEGVSEIRHGGSQDNYQRVYHNHTMCPSHCEKCLFQSAKRYGDITIGDFWGIGKRDLDIDYKKGVSFLGVNTEKGKKFFDSISDDKMSVKKIAQYNWLGGNGMTKNGNNYAGSGRDDFYSAIKKMPFSKACDFALKPNHGYGNKEAYFEKLNPLQFAVKRIHFKYEKEYWEEHEAFGYTMLTVKDSNVGVGHYAVLPLTDSLKKGEKYILSVRFKLRSTVGTLNFHIKDSGSKSFQVIYSYKYDKVDNDKWIEKSVEFTPKSSIFDEFMFGAAQLRGIGAYLAIDYINIIRK